VEDCAEATLRNLQVLATVKNAHLEEDQFVMFDGLEKFKFIQNRWSDEEAGLVGSRLPSFVDRERDYLSPSGIDYRGEFRPELAQTVNTTEVNAREQRKSLTAEQVQSYCVLSESRNAEIQMNKEKNAIRKQKNGS
jgi:hypothetical protein